MKNRLCFLLIVSLLMLSNTMVQAQNPFFQKYNTPHQTIPFDKIKITDYKPAFEEGIKQQMAEIKVIKANKAKPTFENTILPLEKSGALLNRVSAVLFNLLGAETNDDIQALVEELTPILTKNSNDISLDGALFARIKAVYEDPKTKNLKSDEIKLVKDTYIGFIKSGANLEGQAKDKYRVLTEELSKATLMYGQNNLKETNKFELLLTDSTQLKGLPESAIEAAAMSAKAKEKTGWLFTLSATSYGPFIKYCDNRELRKQMSIAFGSKSMHGDELDNQEWVRKIVNTRMEIAQLMGSETYAEYVLRDRMAETPKAVYKLLDELLAAYKPAAQKEVAAVQQYANEKGADFQLAAWDWSYYSEKLKDEQYSMNEEMLRPYFELNNVVDGIFGLATRLYGITFKENKQIPVYNPDVKAYEVFDKDGSYLSVLYTDFHPRAGKRAGAWMSSFKSQWKDKEGDSRPHIMIVMNFTSPTETKPALLTFDEMRTFLHEFGHALHGMLSNTRFESQSGTSVYRDFVELPSQLMENFAIEKDFLDTFAKHYQTGETIPAELVRKIVNSSNYNAAFACLRQLSFGYLDMGWYDRKTAFEGDVIQQERLLNDKAIVLPPTEGTCMSTQFGHIFSGGYAAGYYSYKWAEVLDADAFEAFKKNGIFDEMTATSFREHILSKGGTQHPMELYKKFRGQEPTIDALLKRTGVKK